MKNTLCSLFVLLFFYHAAKSQVSIMKLWVDNNPVKQQNNTPNPVAIHAQFLSQAIKEKNLQSQFLGNTYLFKDYMDARNYAVAMPYLLSAEELAEKEHNTAWQAFIKLRRGWASFFIQHNANKAIGDFKSGVDLAQKAGDSLTVALCYEQMGTMFNWLQNFDSAHYYFNLAIPELRKSTAISLEAIYSNYSGLKLNEGKIGDAFLYNDSALAIVQKQHDQRKINFLLINRAVMLTNIKNYDSSLKILKRTLVSDQANDWIDNIQYDYEGLSNLYRSRGKHDSAYSYLTKFRDLKDSISGNTVNLNVAAIENTYKQQLKDAVLEAAIQKRNGIITLICLMLFIGVVFWRLEHNRNKRVKVLHIKNLNELTRILVEKNEQLFNLNAQLDYKLTKHELDLVTDKKADDEKTVDFGNTLFDQRILTDEDWASFKIYFENAYPGYISRLRNKHNSLTESEERLFLFIKLNLKTKESAAILGISFDSVKKSRNRLRKRLLLDESVDLDTYVKEF